MYELFIEGQKADIDNKISIQLSYAIDDIRNFSSRETSFSKQIILPGTANNNTIFGHIYEMGSNNIDSPGQPNIGSIFNVAQSSRAELRLNGLLILRGIFRLTGIVKDNNFIEYEGALFGELSGLMTQISNKKLEDLDFSQYNHTLTHTAISNSWDNAGGSGYFYPLIDYGAYRDANDNDYNYGTFRPALYVKEYIDKMFSDAGYTYQSTFFNTSYFKSLIIPHNTKQLTKLDTRKLTCTTSGDSFTTLDEDLVPFDNAVGGDFNINVEKDTFTYNNATTIDTNIVFKFSGSYTISGTTNRSFRISLRKNGTNIENFTYTGASGTISINITLPNVINNNDYFEVVVRSLDPNNDNTVSITNISSSLLIDTTSPVMTLIQLGATVTINDTIPKGIFQKDFLASIIKMFNLYIVESREDEKKLLIEPYVDFMTDTDVDWTYKIARDKPWQIRPMGNLNARIFEYKYKDDTDFYNEGYRKKYNINYGDIQFDTGFQFAKDKETTDIIFASSPIIQYPGTDKYLVSIYKKSNELSAEDRMDSNIRILFSKKKSANNWYILGGNSPYLKTSYGYAGHLDDPASSTQDLNFGAPNEVYFTISTYPSANLFNEYWDEYIAQIADKDSKILECYVYLTALDIAQLDFSKSVFIDGIRFRINKVSDYDYTNNELVKVELLKIV